MQVLKHMELVLMIVFAIVCATVALKPAWATRAREHAQQPTVGHAPAVPEDHVSAGRIAPYVSAPRSAGPEQSEMWVLGAD